MGLKKYKINELISVCDERNSYGYTNFCGLNINKEFMPTWANTEGLDESKYKVVRKKRFVFSGMQTGRDECIRISMYNGEEPIIVSPAYTTFEITREDLVLPEYFFMIFLSKEKDRYGAFCSDGSIRSNLDWERFCDFDITLPSIEQQRKYVDVYLSLQNNLTAYQSKVDDLKLVCDGYVEDLKRKVPSKRIGNYILESNVKNSDNKIKEVRSVSVTKEFKLTNAKVNKNELSNYLVVRPKEIAFVQTTGNEKVLAFAYNDQDYPVVVSSVDKVFKSKDENALDLQFLSLYLSRREFDRYARFNSWGSAREVFTMDDMNDVAIPIPDISVQREIVNIHKCYIERQRIAESLKEQLKNICPVLIRGSLTE